MDSWSRHRIPRRRFDERRGYSLRAQTESNEFELSDICLNSDVYVVLFVIAVLADETSAMIYSRVLNSWYRYSDSDFWIELRLMAMCARWLWLNCFILKGLKWGCHFMSKALYTGDNKLVGWCTFSSVSYIYLGLVLLYFRNDFIEYGNADHVILSSTTQNIDAIYVRLMHSWFIRALPSLTCAIFANLVALLTLDHILHRRWWAALAQNSLGRQLAFNSTSILADVVGVWGTRENYNGIVMTMKSRALCTFRWFLATHLIRFGLAEHPRVVRDMATSRLSSVTQGNLPIKVSPERLHKSARTGPVRSASYRVPEGESSTALNGDVDWITKGACDDDDETLVDNTSTLVPDVFLLLQDREGALHLVDGDKREMHGVNMEVKILHNSNVTLG
ncbi:Aste57867_22814 [Aphanomyces stellatus]|uniref:Aste57867_22814 protein n=1 Tax=Aphanomyces stellatus TaxID=120398 RepID=A0A485LM64_9STRA|nr:hypothetical protein As57867_022744 [Aphanomyces stellatus]VFT99465.1 Aste57867_22814 [Aphanomyces stellatus]